MSIWPLSARSFAGLACAQAASARGVRAIVLERKPEPGASPHTTGLLVKEVADEWDIPRRLTRKIHGVRLYSPNLHWVDLVSPGYYFLATDTPAVLRWLAEQAADAGAEVRCDAAYAGATREGDHLQLAGHDLACRYLVGCDGARSRVAKEFHLGKNKALLAGTEAEHEGVTDLDEDRLHVFLDSELRRAISRGSCQAWESRKLAWPYDARACRGWRSLCTRCRRCSTSIERSYWDAAAASFPAAGRCVRSPTTT